MSNTDTATIQAARINARQAVIVAAITGTVTILSTLIATGELFSGFGKDQTSAVEGAQTSSTFAVLEAPELYFSTKPIDLSLQECMTRGSKALTERMGLGGVEAKRYFTWAYNQKTTGLIWCHTDEGLAIFIAAGPDDSVAHEMVQALRRSF